MHHNLSCVPSSQIVVFIHIEYCIYMPINIEYILKHFFKNFTNIYHSFAVFFQLSPSFDLSPSI